MILYLLAFLRNDTATMAQQAAWATSRAGIEDTFLSTEAETAAYSGKLDKAGELSRRAVASAQRAGEKEVAASDEASLALCEAVFGYPTETRRASTTALGLSKGRDGQYKRMALAMISDATQAQTLADDLRKRYPEDTIVQFQILPILNAQLALNRRDAGKAIEALQAAAPYELGFAAGMYAVYLRGEAYLAMHEGSKAAGEFQKIIDHRVVVLIRSVRSPYWVWPALMPCRTTGSTPGNRTKISSRSGKTPTPTSHLKEAKAEYSKLQ